MPLTTTHALVPIAGAIVFAKEPLPWRVLAVATLAAAAPDLDILTSAISPAHPESSPLLIYDHRGAAHSLFVAIAIGLLARLFHKQLRVRPLVAGVAVGAAMASHGLIDMFTDFGAPVAYLWPVSSVRLFADWRPIHSPPVIGVHWLSEGLDRQSYELWHIILPMFAIACAIRVARVVVTAISEMRSAPSARLLRQ